MDFQNLFLLTLVAFVGFYFIGLKKAVGRHVADIHQKIGLILKRLKTRQEILKSLSLSQLRDQSSPLNPLRERLVESDALLQVLNQEPFEEKAWLEFNRVNKSLQEHLRSNLTADKTLGGFRLDEVNRPVQDALEDYLELVEKSKSLQKTRSLRWARPFLPQIRLANIQLSSFEKPGVAAD